MIKARVVLFAVVSMMLGAGCGTNVEDNGSESAKTKVSAPNFVIVREMADGSHVFKTYQTEPTEEQVRKDAESNTGWSPVTKEVTIDKDSGFKNSTAPTLFFVKEGIEGFEAPEESVTQPSDQYPMIKSNSPVVGNSSLFFGLWFDLNLNLGIGNYYGGSFCGQGRNVYASYCSQNNWGYAAYPNYYGYNMRYQHYYPQTAVRWNSYPTNYGYNANAGRFFQNNWAYQPTYFQPGVCQCVNTVNYYCPNTCGAGAQFTNDIGFYAYYDLWLDFNLGGNGCYGYRRWW